MVWLRGESGGPLGAKAWRRVGDGTTQVCLPWSASDRVGKALADTGCNASMGSAAATDRDSVKVRGASGS